LRQWHFIKALAVDVIGHANRDFTDAGEHVELGQEVVRETVDAGGIARNHRVIPATTAGTSGVHADLAAGDLEVLAPLIKKLGRERSGTNAGGVRLDNAQRGGDEAWAMPCDHRSAGGRRVRRS